MRYVHKNDDGTVGLWACVPKALTNERGRFRVGGIRRPHGRTILDCYHEASGVGLTVDVGDDTVDVSDLTDIPGYTIEWPDFERDIKAKLPAPHQARIGDHRRFTRDELIDDRTFRDAWEDTGKLGVNMPKARAVHMARLRAARNDKFAALDAEWMKAVAQKRVAAADQIEAQRQVLRDLPQTAAAQVQGASTPEELKVIWPDELKV